MIDLYICLRCVLVTMIIVIGFIIVPHIVLTYGSRILGSSSPQLEDIITTILLCHLLFCVYRVWVLAEMIINDELLAMFFSTLVVRATGLFFIMLGIITVSGYLTVLQGL